MKHLGDHASDPGAKCSFSAQYENKVYSCRQCQVSDLLSLCASVADPGCFIPDPGSGGVKKHRIPDLGSRILLYIKIGMKNKTNFFLAFYSFRSKF
jgi:hypothetical protein